MRNDDDTRQLPRYTGTGERIAVDIDGDVSCLLLQRGLRAAGLEFRYDVETDRVVITEAKRRLQ